MRDARFVIANWKQNKTLDEALSWCREFSTLVSGVNLNSVTVIVCPPAVFAEKVFETLDSLGVAVGIQDVSPFADGAHTGFIGTDQVKQYCKYAIIGHSERQEPRETVLQKAQKCIDSGVVPVVCFKSVSEYKVIDGAIYALEDPQNISQNGVYKPKNLDEINILIDEARRTFGSKSTIIYGGSVSGENAQDLAFIQNLNGVLVGKASLNPHEFTDIVRKFSL